MSYKNVLLLCHFADVDYFRCFKLEVLERLESIEVQWKLA